MSSRKKNLIFGIVYAPNPKFKKKKELNQNISNYYETLTYPHSEAATIAKQPPLRNSHNYIVQ